MDKISIDVLFPSNEKNRFGDIDIKSVCNTYYNVDNYDTIFDSKVRTTDFDIQDLISKKEQRKKRLENLYQSIINNCLEKIKRADMVDKTDIIFNVMNNELINPNFDINECFYKLQKRLRNLKFKTIRISSTELFITWHHIVELG